MKFEFSSGRWLEIESDYDFNPRDNFNICTMYCTNNRYFSLDAVLPSDFDPEEEKAKGNIVVPIYAIVHSGVSISHKPFNDPWDSGLSGYAVATPEQIERGYGKCLRTKEQIEQSIRDEIDEMNAFMNGESMAIYLYDDNKTDDFVDSFVSIVNNSNIVDTILNLFELTEEEAEELKDLTI